LGNVGTLVTFRVGAMDTEILEKEFDPVFFANDLVNLDKYNIYLKLMIDGVSTRPFSAKTLFPIDISDTAKNAKKVIQASRDKYADKRETVEQKIMDWSGMKKMEVVHNIQALAKGAVVGNNNSQQKQIKNNNSNKAKNNDKKTKNNNNQNKQSGQSTSQINQDIFGIPSSDSSQNTFVKNKKSVVSNRVKQKEQVQSKSERRQQTSRPKNNDKENISTTVECSGCSKDTVINFIPDGVRPVFCKDCLKEYRRAQAKLQAQNNQQSPAKYNNTSKNNNFNNGAEKGSVKIVKRTKKESDGPKIDSDAVQALIKDALDKE